MTSSFIPSLNCQSSFDNLALDINNLDISRNIHQTVSSPSQESQKFHPYLSHAIASGNPATQPHHSLTSVQLSKHLHPPAQTDAHNEKLQQLSSRLSASLDENASKTTLPAMPSNISNGMSQSTITQFPDKVQLNSATNGLDAGCITSDLQSSPYTSKHNEIPVSVPQRRHVSYTEDSLTVDLMRLPRTKHYSYAPAKSTLMLQVPPMHDVWLDDDDDDEDDETLSDIDSDDNPSSSHLSFSLRRNKKQENKSSFHNLLSSHSDLLSHISNTNSNSNSDTKKNGRLRHSFQRSKAFDNMPGSTINVNDANNSTAKSWKNIRFSWTSTSNDSTHTSNNHSNSDDATILSKSPSSSSTVLSKPYARASIISVSSTATSSTTSSPLNLSYRSPSISLTSSSSKRWSKSSPNNNTARPISFADIAICNSANSNLPGTYNHVYNEHLKNTPSSEVPAHQTVLASSSPQSSTTGASVSSLHSKRSSRASYKLFSFLNSKSPKASSMSPASYSPTSAFDSRQRRMNISSPTNFVHTAHVGSNSLAGLQELSNTNRNKLKDTQISDLKKKVQDNIKKHACDEASAINGLHPFDETLMELTTCQNGSEYNYSTKQKFEQGLLPAFELKDL